MQQVARVDGGIVATIRGLDGVAAAIGDRSIPVEILDVAGAAAVDPVEVTGHGWEGIALTDATLKVGRQPHRPDEIVVDGLRVDGRVPRPGDRLTIATAHTTSAFRVVGITNESSRDAAVYFTTAEARRLAGTGAAVDLIGVVAAHGVDVPKLARRIDSIARSRGLHVTTGTRRGDVESYVDALNRDGVVSGLSVLGVLGLFVALFVISGAFALSVQQRHRELALLRAIGATPRQVKRMIALESLVVALVGALAAWGLGVLVASAERELCVRAGVLPESFELTIGWLPPVIGAVVAVVTTRLAVFASARRASRIRPVDALRESTAEARPLTRVRLIAGLAVVVLGTIVFLSTTRNLSESGGDDAPAAGIVWMLAAVLLGPVLALPFVWAVGGLLERLSPASGLLAKANARANLRRLTSVATPLMLAVSLGCALLASRGTVEHHTATQSRQSVLADRILVSHGSGLPPDAITAARRVPGVRGVVSTFPTTMVVDSAGHPVTVDTRVANGVSLPMAVDLDVRDGSLSALHGNTFAADAQQAGALGWEVGDRIRLWRGDGTPVALELVAIYRRPLGFAHIVVPPPVVDAHVTNAFAKTAFVTFLPTADPAAVDRALERAAGPSNEVEVMSSDEYHASVAAQVRRDSFAAFATRRTATSWNAGSQTEAFALIPRSSSSASRSPSPARSSSTKSARCRSRRR